MSIIEVRNLCKTYHSDGVATKAVQDVSFAIERGEFVAVMGPSGSGKSTLLHMLGFLDAPTSGIYQFEGRDYQDYEKEELALVRNQKIGFVFQAFNLLPRQSVRANVLLPLMYSNAPEHTWAKRVEKAITSVGLEKRGDYKASQLSGGEKQRVAIARALVMDPAVIFADEPTGNLDSNSGRQVLEILQALNRDTGHTILLITHEHSTANHAGRIISFLDGRLESDAVVDEPLDARVDYQK